MNIILLDAGTLGDDLSFDVLSSLGTLRVYATTSPDELSERVRDADVLILNKIKITRQVLAFAPRLRLICITATGYDNIDVAAARERGVAVCNIPGYSTPSVVQVTLAMALSLSTHLPAFADHVSSGAYAVGGVANCLVPVYHELAGKTWGIVGYGNIGRGVADVARALGCQVLVYRRHANGSSEECDIDTLCRESDVISLHCPLTDETRRLIDDRRIGLMKRGVMLLNAARGAVTDEEAVSRAVLSGQIGAFGCDVYSTEPFGKEHPFSALLGLPNVCLTPHMAWGSYEARVRCIETIASNIRAFLAGERQNRVD